MGCISIGRSNEHTSEDIVMDIMEIEEEVFKYYHRGSYQAILDRFRKFKDMFVLAYDGDRVVGYLNYFPITEELYSKIFEGNELQDDNIEPESICDLKDCKYIYLMSVAVNKDYQNKGIGNRMVSAFNDIIYRYIDDGINISNIITSTVTKYGENLIKSYDFKEVNGYQRIGDFKVYMKETN